MTGREDQQQDANRGHGRGSRRLREEHETTCEHGGGFHRDRDLTGDDAYARDEADSKQEQRDAASSRVAGDERKG